MSKLISCEFNIDTACVELLFADGSMISIDCIAVENEIADNRFDRAELDWLLYNKPLEYADLVLNGGIEEYTAVLHPEISPHQASQHAPSAVLPPAGYVCDVLLPLQICWTLSCPTRPAGRSPLCRLQSQI